MMNSLQTLNGTWKRSTFRHLGDSCEESFEVIINDGGRREEGEVGI